MIDQLVVIAFTILLPITPAYILYKALPARASVKGPFKGLSIQLSGAFAGYFLLVLLIFGHLNAQPQKNPYEVWRVRGQLDDSIKDGARLSLLPPNLHIDSEGRFDVTIATKPGLDGGLEFPKLHVEHSDYETVDIDLNEAKPEYGDEKSCKILRNDKLKALNLESFVVLKKRDLNYDTSGQKGQNQDPVPATEPNISGSEVGR